MIKYKLRENIEVALERKDLAVMAGMKNKDKIFLGQIISNKHWTLSLKRIKLQLRNFQEITSYQFA